MVIDFDNIYEIIDLNLITINIPKIKSWYDLFGAYALSYYHQKEKEVSYVKNSNCNLPFQFVF